MKKISDSELLNHVIQWIGDKVIIQESFRMQHELDFEFVAMGHGWVEFDLNMWDGSTLRMAAWVDRDATELTITNRSPSCSFSGNHAQNPNFFGSTRIARSELTFLDVIQLT